MGRGALPRSPAKVYGSQAGREILGLRAEASVSPGWSVIYCGKISRRDEVARPITMYISIIVPVMNSMIV